MPTFKVWLAADTPLYLPIYALADLGVLARVAATVGFTTETRIEIQPAPAGGDRSTIEHMLQQAERAEESVIHIAIGDPTAACLIEGADKKLALLGAFIKRPSFWLIGRPNDTIKENAHHYVYYTDRFQTGSFLGRQVVDEAGGDDVTQVSMGKEFELLFEPEDIVGRLRVLTADIVGVATVQEKDPSIQVIESLGTLDRYENFVTVGIMTHNHNLKNYKQQVALFLEAVRSACVLLRTAEKPAAALVRELIERGFESRQAVTEIEDAPAVASDAIAPKIARMLFEDRVYSNTLAVTPSDWKGAVDARFTQPKARLKAEALFLSIYRPNVADTFTAEWLSKTFRDYGRFVQGIRVLKYSIWAALFTMVLSQVLLKLAYESEAPNWLSKATPQTLYLTSLVTALVSATWLVFAMITAGSNRLRPLSRFGYFLITKTGALGLPLFTVAAMAVGLTACYLFKIPIGVDNVITAFTPLLAASCWPAIELFFKRRYA